MCVCVCACVCVGVSAYVFVHRCIQALEIIGRYMVRAVHDPSDLEARHGLMFAALLAGISFGNSGVHLPHSMAYSVAGLVGDYCTPGYDAPTGATWAQEGLTGLVPHGMSVIVNAPACFRFTVRPHRTPTSRPLNHQSRRHRAIQSGICGRPRLLARTCVALHQRMRARCWP